MGKVDDQKDAVNEGVAECDQRIDRSPGDSLNEEIPPYFAAVLAGGQCGPGTGEGSNHNGDPQYRKDDSSDWESS